MICENIFFNKEVSKDNSGSITMNLVGAWWVIMVKPNGPVGLSIVMLMCPLYIRQIEQPPL